jgi:hypothetical protein
LSNQKKLSGKVMNMKIYNSVKKALPFFCITHRWRQVTDQTDGQQQYICEKCGRSKRMEPLQELHILLPEQFRS